MATRGIQEKLSDGTITEIRVGGSAATDRVVTQTAISNVDNTSDADKPVSIAAQTALDLKRDLTDLEFGAVSDHTKFYPDGTLRAIGEATAWDDLRVPAERTKKVASKEAKDVAYRGGSIINFEDSVDQGIAFSVQLPHAWLQGSDIEFHIHYVLPVSGSGAGAENVKFDFTHSWANINEAFPAETTVPVILDVQDGVAHFSKILDMGDLTATGKTLSSQIICSLVRNGANALDTYTGDIYVTEVDFHYQIDGFGSAQEYIKDPV